VMDKQIVPHNILREDLSSLESFALIIRERRISDETQKNDTISRIFIKLL